MQFRECSVNGVKYVVSWCTTDTGPVHTALVFTTTHQRHGVHTSVFESFSVSCPYQAIEIAHHIMSFFPSHSLNCHFQHSACLRSRVLSKFSKTVFACLHENSRLPCTKVHNFGGSRKSRFHTAPFEIVLVRPVRRAVNPFSNKHFLQTWSQFTGCYICVRLRV